MAAAPQDPETTLPATPARQGALGRPILVVLVVSTALAATLLIASWLTRSGDLAATEPPEPAQKSDAETFMQEERAPLAVPPEATPGA